MCISMHFQKIEIIKLYSVCFVLDSGCDSVTDTETEDEKTSVYSCHLAMNEEHESSKSTGEHLVVQPDHIRCGVPYSHFLVYVLVC